MSVCLYFQEDTEVKMFFAKFKTLNLNKYLILIFAICFCFKIKIIVSQNFEQLKHVFDEYSNLTKKDGNNFNSIEEAIGDEFQEEVEIGDKLCLLAQVKLVRSPAKYWAQRLKEEIDVTKIILLY